MTSQAFGAFLWLLTGSGPLLAQPPDSASAQSATVSGPQSPQWSRLSLEEKLRYDARHFADIDNFVYAGGTLMKPRRFAKILAGLLIMASGMVQAQVTTATVYGNITDPTGAPFREASWGNKYDGRNGR